MPSATQQGPHSKVRHRWFEAVHADRRTSGRMRPDAIRTFTRKLSPLFLLNLRPQRPNAAPFQAGHAARQRLIKLLSCQAATTAGRR